MGEAKARPGKRGAQAAILTLAAFLLYLPLGTWFQGDDFLAVTYAHDPAAVLHDFTGPQYSLTGHTLFWRPLITLSFGIESFLFGGNPLGYHLDNALVHALNALLLFLVLQKLLGRKWAFRAALLWAFHPAQALPVLWTVGRVDVHCVFWMLLSLLLLLRALEGRGKTAPALLSFAAALATKELALILPGPVFLAAWLRSREVSFLRKVRSALAAALPFLLLLLPYFALRRIFLGRFIGGYMAERTDLTALPFGLATWTARLLFPLGSDLGIRALGEAALYAAWAGGLAWLIRTFLFLGKKEKGEARGGTAFGILLFLGACLPVYAFLAQPEELKHLRYFYLPLAGLAVLASAAGWKAALLVLLLYLPVHFPLRSDFHRAMEYDRKVHLGLLHAASRLGKEKFLFVKEEPPPDTGVAVTLFLGLERMLLPPFGKGTPEILRWRPFLFPWQDPLAFQERETAFPLEPRVLVTTEGEVRLQPLSAPRLPLFRVSFQGPPALGRKELEPLALGSADYLLRPVPPGPGLYRVLWLTPLGYLACRIEAEEDGNLSLKKILLSPATRTGKGLPLFLQLALALDVSPSGRTYLLLEQVKAPGGPVLSRAAELLPLPFRPSAVSFLLLQKP